jgi:hypothetical protein
MLPLVLSLEILSMSEFLSRFSPGEMIALAAVVGGLILGTVTIVAVYWHKIRKAEIDSRLKMNMLDRGMNLEEIEAILDAGKSACDE